MDDNLRRKILKPEAGTALARARDFGIDLTQLLEGLIRTPEQRLERAAQAQALARALRESGEVPGGGRS